MSLSPNIDGTDIKIESVDHLNSLIGEGYEIISWSLHAQGEIGTKITLVLEKNGTSIRADGSQISDHVIQLQSLYDSRKKKEVFVWVPNTSLYWDLQKKFMHIAYGDHKSPIVVRSIQHRHTNLIYDSLNNWVEKHHNLIYKNNRLSSIFYSVCIINAKADNVQTLSYEKELLNLDIIEQITSSAQKYDVSIALSFIFLAEKYSHNQGNKEMLIGIVAYDLRTKSTLCFNIISMTAFYVDNKYDRNKPVLYDITHELFRRSVAPDMQCKSFVPIPISTEWYTAMPWLTYVSLQPMKSNTNNVVGKRNLSIPEFLIFGYSELITKGNSFVFTPFSSTTSGRATCILKFNDNNTKIAYNLRFDQWSGEKQIHADYSFFDPREVKLVKHLDLDLEAVYTFSPDLFVAILAAGLYDANFSTVIEKGLEGSAKLVRDNPAYFYPLNHIWAVQNAIDWLSKEPQRYDALEKLASHLELNSSEIETINYLRNNFIGVIAGENGKLGTGLLGNAILARRHRNQTQQKM